MPGIDHGGERDRECSGGGGDFQHVRDAERGSGDGKHHRVYVSGCGFVDGGYMYDLGGDGDQLPGYDPQLYAGVGDALAVQVVTTGTVVIAPAIKIIAEYGVTGGGGGGSPGGSPGQTQTNNAGSFGGLAGTSISANRMDDQKCCGF